MKTESKTEIVKTALILEGIILILIGSIHCIFPEEAHILMEQYSFDINNPWMWAAVQEIGILFFVFGLAAILAASDLLRHKYLIFFVILASILSDTVRSSAILFHNNSPKLWLVVIASVILWSLVVIFYPYQQLKKVVK